MRIKAYFSDTVEAAMQRACQELGEGALLLGSQLATGGAASLGRYEVTFGVPGEPEQPVEQAPLGKIAQSPENAPGVSPAMEDLRQIRMEIEEMRSRLVRPEGWVAAPLLTAPYSWLYSRLADAGIGHPLAGELLAAVQQKLSNRLKRGPLSEEAEEAERLLAAEMESRIKTHRLGSSGAQRAVVALTGPAGAGKTTTAIKLAILHGIAKGRKVRLLSLDGGRIAGGLLLRSYAALLDFDHLILDSPDDLAAIIAESHPAELVLIDTPGYAPGQREALTETARWIEAEKEIETHLVLPATLDSADLRQACQMFGSFRPTALILTRLDEVQSLAGVFVELSRMPLPLSFCSAGQEIPESLEEVSAAKLVSRLMGRLRVSAKAAAA